MNRCKLKLIDKITTLLYDLDASELESIYSALCDILYKEGKSKWTTKPK